MCQLLWSKLVATKKSLLKSILEEFHWIRKVHVANVCMYWHALLTCTIHIIDAYSSTTKENASSSIYIYIYIHLIRLQGYSKHICALGVLIQHMAMAYATSMLPISQGTRETSISTWRLLFIWYIDILYTCSKIIVYYHTWNYFLAKHKYYMISVTQQIEQWRFSLSFTQKYGTTHHLHIKHGVCRYFPLCCCLANSINVLTIFVLFGLGSCSCYITRFLRLRHAVALLSTGLLFKFCKILSICRPFP